MDASWTVIGGDLAAEEAQAAGDAATYAQALGVRPPAAAGTPAAASAKAGAMSLLSSAAKEHEKKGKKSGLSALNWVEIIGGVLAVGAGGYLYWRHKHGKKLF